MPTRPMPPCSVPGCGARSLGHGRCAAHEAERRRQYDATRGSAAERGYGADWRAKRAAFLRAHPACELCGAIATEAHHRVARRDGGSDDWVNLAALCQSCHSQVTARTQGFARR